MLLVGLDEPPVFLPEHPVLDQRSNRGFDIPKSDDGIEGKAVREVLVSIISHDQDALSARNRASSL